MKALLNAGTALKLDNIPAAEIMAPNPISIAANANVQEALMLLTDKNISAAPVIDDAGRAVGVISRSDLLVHDREAGRKVGPASGEYPAEGDNARRILEGYQVETIDRATVEDIMTPAVFSVRPDTPVSKVVSEMIGLHVHRIFVTDDDGTLIGVISTMDLLKRLRPY
ncbi:MAG: CBS domain-containing protein [Planctomycetota bacterium]|jgi:CBS domain-containing protein